MQAQESKLPPELLAEVVNFIPNASLYSALWRTHTFFAPTDDRLKIITTNFLQDPLNRFAGMLRDLNAPGNAQVNVLEISLNIVWEPAVIPQMIAYLEKLLTQLIPLKMNNQTNLSFIVFTDFNKYTFDDSGAFAECTMHHIAPVFINLAYHFGHEHLFDFFYDFFGKERDQDTPTFAVQVKTICQLSHIALSLKELPEGLISDHPELMRLHQAIHECRCVKMDDVYYTLFNQLVGKLNLDIGVASGRGGHIIRNYEPLQDYMTTLMHAIEAAGLTDQLLNPVFGTRSPAGEAVVTAPTQGI